MLPNACDEPHSGNIIGMIYIIYIIYHRAGQLEFSRRKRHPRDRWKSSLKMHLTGLAFSGLTALLACNREANWAAVGLRY